ncbi:MAG: oligopeptide transporter, OPT family [Deltaproteobacteria bacterium]|nr:oligopeptide transporter, OPT family [Deltaproteobacteria bacterium]
MTPQAPLREFTLRAVVTGIALGLVFGAANAYLGLRVGLTVSASIPAVVMTVALFRAFRARASILEANLSQTVGSASTSLATGTIFTVPALYLWGVVPPYSQVVLLAFLGGVLGLSAMIPLRRLLVEQGHDELPYPEGTACAVVLRATSDDSQGGKLIFGGILAGAAVKLLLSVAFLMPGELDLHLPVLPQAVLAIELAPALVGVGFILGHRQSAILVAGSVISSLVLIPLIAWFGAGLTAPLYPETVKLVSQMDAGAIWSRYVRYIGAGAVAIAGILTVLKTLPSMVESFLAVIRAKRTELAAGARTLSLRELVSSAAPAPQQDLSGRFVLGGVALVVLSAAFVPYVFGTGLTPLQRAICAGGAAIFGVLFVTVAARIVGIVGVSSQPTSGITLVSLIGIASIFAAFGWTDPVARAGVLTVGTIVAIAASKAGDISQDLKTGFLVGATPARQQLGQLLGAAFACWGVAASVHLLGEAFPFGGKDLPAPQATLMKTIVEGVLSGNLPWGLVLTGGGLTFGAILCGVSGLAFAIGVYLPLSSMAPIYLGGVVRAWTERGRAPREEGELDPGVLAASGMVAGEGLAGVLVAALVAGKLVPKSMEPRVGGVAGSALTALAFLGVAWMLRRAARTSVQT